MFLNPPSATGSIHLHCISLSLSLSLSLHLYYCLNPQNLLHTAIDLCFRASEFQPQGATMKIQCSVCELAEASVLCCADEAALCFACDEKIHAANKLASKHQRVPLSCSSSPMPKCDICQETVGYIFCLEDRALFCRKCDVAIHTANTLVSSHRRFLLTGVKVGLESMASGASSSLETAPPPSLLKRATAVPSAAQYDTVLSVQSAGFTDLSPPKLPFAGGDSAAGTIPQWQLEGCFGLTELDKNFSFIDDGSSKADNGKLGGFECPSMLRYAGEELEVDGEECLGEVPDASWMVPKVHSVFVPDIYWTTSPCYETNIGSAGYKRTRQF